jgi:hypothetical protein
MYMLNDFVFKKSRGFNFMNLRFDRKVTRQIIFTSFRHNYTLHTTTHLDLSDNSGQNSKYQYIFTHLNLSLLKFYP